MGVDARILIKITDPSSWLDHKQLRKLSARLTEAIGHDHFFLDVEQDRHAISFCIDDYAKYPEEYEEATGHPYSPTGPGIFGQDSAEEPYIIAEPTEQFLEVHLWSRYYGKHYARGDWTLIFFTLMWCVRNFEDAEVWYGGDSSGCLMEHMTSERMMEITNYFMTDGGTSYRASSRTSFQCEFCGVPVMNSGGGGGTEYYYCSSCGQNWIIEREGAFKRMVSRFGDEPTDDKYGDKIPSFKMSQELREGKRKLYPFDGTFRKRYAPIMPKTAVN
jgi:hypothetical protein